jgi:hypothetical protein
LSAIRIGRCHGDKGKRPAIAGPGDAQPAT